MGHADPGDFQDREQQQREQLRRNSVSLEAELRDLRWLMSGANGRRVVWNVLVACSVLAQEVVPSAGAMWAYEGNRALGMRWFELIHAYPDLFRFYPQMVNENLHVKHDRDGAADPAN